MTQWGIDTLFNPGKRHMDEEKRRLQSTREEVGDSSGGRRIDLESGTVRLAGKSDQDAPESEAAEAGAPENGAAVASQNPAEAATDAAEAVAEHPAEDTPAARARRRRRAAG